MPELRRDPLTGESVLIAAARGGRPGAFRRGDTTKNDDRGSTVPHDPECPFCTGNEARTPPEVARTPPDHPDGPGWSVRVFPNLYPLVGSDRTGERSVTGVHEVVVLSPVHDRSFGRLDEAQAANVLSVARSRAVALASAGSLHVQVFVNHGPDAGASLFHPHAQIVALDRVPEGVAAGVARFGATGPETSRHDPVSAACDEADGPRGLGRHGLSGHGSAGSEAVAIWCPHASVEPYQVRLALPGGGATFGDATDGQVRSMAGALRTTLARLDALLDDPPYNVIVRNAPVGVTDFHWYVDVLPRLTVFAGFEIATGLAVNIVDPETAATDLRGAGNRRVNHSRTAG